MKAYEKWVEQNMYDRTETEKAWKAALGWVSDKCSHLEDTCCLDCNCFGIVQNHVDEELNGKA